jgi:hypothetical protein
MFKKIVGIICQIMLIALGADGAYSMYTMVGTTVPAHTFTWESGLTVALLLVTPFLLGAGIRWAPKPLPIVLDKFRMAAWLAFGIAAYFASIAVGPDNPVIQTTLYKIGHVTTLAWIGYWISRNAIGRLDLTSDTGDKLGRAIVMGAVIIAGSLGL